MIQDDGRVGEPTGLSSTTEPVPVSALTGFDPSRDNCGNCQHWQFDRPDWQFNDLRIGECKAVKMREDIEIDALEGTGLSRYDDEAAPLLKAALEKAKAIAVDGSGYYAGLRTVRDFGCVLHSRRCDSGRHPEGENGEAG